MDITPILDSRIVTSAADTYVLPADRINHYLVSLLQDDEQLVKEYGCVPDVSLAIAIKESAISCTFKTRDLVMARTGANESRADFTFNGKTVLDLLLC